MSERPAHDFPFIHQGHEGIAILMVPEDSELMNYYEEAAAGAEREEEYDGLEITLEQAASAGVTFRPAGSGDDFKEEYLFCRPACHLEVAMLVNGSEYVKVGDASVLFRKDEVKANVVAEEFRWMLICPALSPAFCERMPKPAPCV
jgi:hypothetical protein